LDAGNLKIEFERAIAELRELCNADLPLDERKHLLAVRKEMNRMYRLYTAVMELAEATDDGESETLTEIRGHLEPLGLAEYGTPLPELARLAALRLLTASPCEATEI
jgi:hypothetical protein